MLERKTLERGTAEYVAKFLLKLEGRTPVLKSRPKGYPAGSGIFLFVAQISTGVLEQKYSIIITFSSEIRERELPSNV